MDKRPIGVFDSGAGGLTVVKALLETLPNEDIIYLGDTARVPYGIKSKETVTKFSIECVTFLRKFNVKMVVVACNTVSSWSLETLKRTFNFPIIGVIKPGVKEACQKTKNLKVGVIGTKATVKSLSYVKEISKINPRVKTYQKACPLFVPMVEEKRLAGKIVYAVVEDYLKDLKKHKIDTLILGCTHYPLLKGEIYKVFLPGINIIDSSLSVSCAVKEFLYKEGLAKRAPCSGNSRFFVTDDADSFRGISKVFLKKDINVKKVRLI